MNDTSTVHGDAPKIPENKKIQLPDSVILTPLNEGSSSQANSEEYWGLRYVDYDFASLPSGTHRF